MRACGVFACLVLLGGCALVPKFEEPQLDVVDVHLLRGDLLQQELSVTMRVHNPNQRALSVRSIQYEVQLEGEEFAHGESQREFIVPAHGDTQFDLSVTANALGAILRLLGGGRRNSVEYQVSGIVTLATGLKRSIPFDERGEFRLR